MDAELGQLIIQNILVVCLGNICRSPIGEQILRQHLPDIKISSAGLRAVIGHGIDPGMAAAAAKYQINVGEHYARQLNPDLCRQQDLILVMENTHLTLLTHIAPQAQGKTLLFGHWCAQAEILDPFNQHQSIYDGVVQQLGNSAQKWIAMLKTS